MLPVGAPHSPRKPSLPSGRRISPRGEGVLSGDSGSEIAPRSDPPPTAESPARSHGPFSLTGDTAHKQLQKGAENTGLGENDITDVISIIMTAHLSSADSVPESTCSSRPCLSSMSHSGLSTPTPSTHTHDLFCIVFITHQIVTLN